MRGIARRYAQVRGDRQGLVPGLHGRLRRSAEGGAEGPGAANGTGHTQNEATDLPATLAFTTIKAGRWSGPIFGILLHSFGRVQPLLSWFIGLSNDLLSVAAGIRFNSSGFPCCFLSADAEHVEILRRGPRLWRARANPTNTPNLTSARWAS
jgi:hypothetical protein